ncbi:MAG: hypothetical protein KU38_00665 [Sulfurovum sp. FS08-3]|nr:MAG: hypothetical protein KU38_00665 [Sulfurovum sp. FS08-3]
MDPFLGEIKAVGFDFAPRGWALCNGQILQINQYQALYSLIGTTYGGDGHNTFALPDLRGRVGVHQGQGLNRYVMGQKAGTETHTLSAAQMPSHTHLATFAPTSSSPFTANVAVKAKDGLGDTNSANAHYWATGKTQSGPTILNVVNGYSSSANTTMASDAVSVSVSGGMTQGSVTNQATGGNQPFSIVQPYLTLNYIIALEGYYPSKD